MHYQPTRLFVSIRTLLCGLSTSLSKEPEELGDLGQKRQNISLSDTLSGSSVSLVIW